MNKTKYHKWTGIKTHVFTQRTLKGCNYFHAFLLLAYLKHIKNENMNLQSLLEKKFNGLFRTYMSGKQRSWS